MDQQAKITMIPRQYQLDLLKEVKKMNTILYLPTGSGKTYIATMLIKEMAEPLSKPLGNGRKWTIFLVQSVPLVGQHAKHLEKHLPWTIGSFTGDMNVDYWSHEIWLTILSKCHILIMTAQIYLNNLRHGYMKIEDANLIIIDECHHAVALHPFRQVMQVLHTTDFKTEKKPHILGLTATLINSNSKNIKEDLIKLQQTLNATIKTRYEKDIQIFSARPKEIISLYDEYILSKELIAISERIKLFNEQIRQIQIATYNEPIREDSDIYHFESNKNYSKTIANYFLDMELMMKDNGSYMSYLSTWHYIIEIEKKKKICSNIDKYMLLTMALSEVTIIRKMLFDSMEKKSKNISLLNNSSPKLRELMNILASIFRTDVCLVFVDRRSTAKMLYHYIKDYICEYNMKNIECDFIVGSRGIGSPESIELLYKKQQNNDIIKKFNENIINVLITSEVLEEGVDIQTCNYVIRYDCPKNFPSYVQSKGRARSNDSNFIVMVPNKEKFEQTHLEYVKIEEEINKILIKQEIDDDNIDEILLDVFKTKFATLNHDIAISIIFRYCQSLPQDRFTNLTPEWYFSANNEKKFKYKLLLPMNSIIKSIDGKFCLNKKNAKKSAAFNACILLYKANVLDEYLMPISIINKSIFEHSKWFPNWIGEDIEANTYKLKPGTNKMKRMVHIESPLYLHGALPLVNKQSYLHVLHCVPNYSELKDSKYEIFNTVLKSNKEFGILTSNKLPNISNFPIFLPFGDINVNIKVNAKTMYLDHEHLEKLEHFHNNLFLDVLGVKDFIVRSYSNGHNSYLIIPIYFSDGTYNVDWNVMSINKFVETKPPTKEQIKSKFYEKYLEMSNVIISPWYRNIVPIQRYIVTDIYYDITPESTFPTSEYATYETYFNDKYGISVVNKNQPMIKVKSLGVSKINYLTPKLNSGKIDKRSEYIEILVPELCMWHQFPSAYWLKALMLPTILYRITKLLLADDLLVKINSICNINVQTESNADTVEIDKFCGFNQVKKKTTLMPLGEAVKYIDNECNAADWNSNNLPVDIERQTNTTMLDVLTYHKFILPSNSIKSNSVVIQQNTTLDSTPEIDLDYILHIVLNEINTFRLTTHGTPILSPLVNSRQKIGQSDILKVLTPPFAHDMFNYERMETYGDSFLKFASSLVLFDAFESENEGVLTELKMKLVGNRNLFYVGKNLNIGSYLTVNAFEPTMDWIPPCFVVPQKLKEIIEESQIQSDVLHQIVIPRDDQFSGYLSDKSWNDIETELLKFKNLCDMSDSDEDEDKVPVLGHSQSDLFVHKQSVSDKMIADSIESLIGIYVFKYGIQVGFKVLNGLGIIPEEFIHAFKPKPIHLDELYKYQNYSCILPGYEILEERIGYPFKHKHLLIQALTHPTYQLGFSDCYQRLEFLGDAILDFLITTYIIQYFNNKTPGEITDIRSALVNNITFASLSVRIGLHRFFLYKSVKLTEVIGRFVEYQQRNKHKIGQEVLYLIEDSDCLAAESVDVPKVLGDLFESLIAAIYLDCNRDLNTVWRICYSIMADEIKEFCTNIPKNPIRILHETKLQPVFSKPNASILAANRGLGTMVQLDLYLNNNNMTIYGFGQNKKEAKVAAAKMALKHMKKTYPS